MVSPTAFGFNEQTAQDNHFMHQTADTGGGSVAAQVVREFAALHHQLSEVHGAPSTPQHATARCSMGLQPPCVCLHAVQRALPTYNVRTASASIGRVDGGGWAASGFGVRPPPQQFQGVPRNSSPGI